MFCRARARPFASAVDRLAIAIATMPWAASAQAAEGVLQVAGVPVEFALFALTLLTIAFFHRRALHIALLGAAVVVAYRWLSGGFPGGPGLPGLLHHLHAHWVTLANLLLLITGFALVAEHFHQSRIPRHLPRLLPDDWKGGFVLLCLIFVLSAFLDNIAAALIGGTVAADVFRRRLHVGYLAAIVAASNAGGAGSVVGDTTTTMMWIQGASPADVLRAYAGAATALLVFGVPASIRQQRHSPIRKDPPDGAHLDWPRVFIVLKVLTVAIAANVAVNVLYPEAAETLPWIGLAVWGAVLLASPLRGPSFAELPSSLRSSAFLLALVLTASLMPVSELPAPSWMTTLALGAISAVFDNIPLTALALEQGGYDWGVLAYAVGFGGSMLWFGSSAGVALCGLFPEGRSALHWIRDGWPVALAYLAGFAVLLFTLGWQPQPLR